MTTNRKPREQVMIDLDDDPVPVSKVPAKNQLNQTTVAALPNKQVTAAPLTAKPQISKPGQPSAATQQSQTNPVQAKSQSKIQVPPLIQHQSEPTQSKMSKQEQPQTPAQVPLTSTPQPSNSPALTSLPKTPLSLQEKIKPTPAKASEDNYVSFESAEFKSQLQMLQQLKTKPFASQCSICVTCWMLIMSSDKDIHNRATHIVTGHFGQMAAAQKDSLKQLSESKGRVNSAGLVQLFARSDEFTIMNTEPEAIKSPQILLTPAPAPVLSVLAKMCESDAKATQQPLENQVDAVQLKPKNVTPPSNQDQASKAPVEKPATQASATPIKALLQTLQPPPEKPTTPILAAPQKPPQTSLSQPPATKPSSQQPSKRSEGTSPELELSISLSQVAYSSENSKKDQNHLEKVSTEASLRSTEAEIMVLGKRPLLVQQQTHAPDSSQFQDNVLMWLKTISDQLASFDPSLKRRKL